MNMQALRSIRLRLTLWYVVLLAVILAGFSAGIYLTLRHNLYGNLDDSLTTRANDLMPLVSYDGARPRCHQTCRPAALTWESSSSVSTTPLAR